MAEQTYTGKPLARWDEIPEASTCASCGDTMLPLYVSAIDGQNPWKTWKFVCRKCDTGAWLRVPVVTTPTGAGGTYMEEKLKAAETAAIAPLPESSGIVVCPKCKASGIVGKPQFAKFLDIDCNKCKIGFRIDAADFDRYVRRTPPALPTPEGGLYDPLMASTTAAQGAPWSWNDLSNSFFSQKFREKPRPPEPPKPEPEPIGKKPVRKIRVRD